MGCFSIGSCTVEPTELKFGMEELFTLRRLWGTRMYGSRYPKERAKAGFHAGILNMFVSNFLVLQVYSSIGPGMAKCKRPEINQSKRR